MYAFLACAGLLLTHTFAHSALVRNDRRVSRWFYEQRTPALDTLTHLGSLLSDTVTVIVVTAVLVVVLRVWRGRWRESATIVLSIVGELSIFVLVTATVHRSRPSVPHLDPAPPTSSFPSGHVGAAVALYVGLAVIILMDTRDSVHRRAAVAVAAMLCLVPVIVATSRVYRGMHFLTDVCAGALAGGLWMVVVVMTVLAPHVRSRRHAERVPAT